MQTILRVLSEEELNRIHAETLKILAGTGVKVDSSRARGILQNAGAQVDENSHIVKFPQNLVEECLRLAPQEFYLTGRRPGNAIAMNQGNCGIVLDGGAIYTFDTTTRSRRPANLDDWYQATRLGDTLDDVDVYWSVVEGCWGHSPKDVVAYWRAIFQNFSKHVQDATMTPEESRWMLEVLQVIFGSREEVRKSHPISFVLCPASPLIIEAGYTDAYLETLEWGIPAAVMTMPLLGISSPATLISELVLANCETIAMLCLIQAASPGTPFIYAAVPAVTDLRSGRFGGGEAEHSLLGAAVTEIARYYHLPVEASVGGSDQSVPGIQASYERALNFALPILSKPDLLVAPGLLGGSTIFSPEQLMIDLEVIRRCKRLSHGVSSASAKWLGEVIETHGPGGNYLAQKSTRIQARSGEIYFSNLGVHESYEQWTLKGSPELLSGIQEEIQSILQNHRPLPLPEEMERELALLQMRAEQETHR